MKASRVAGSSKGGALVTQRRALGVVVVATTLLTAGFIFSIVNAISRGGGRHWVWTASFLPLLVFSWLALVVGSKRGRAVRAQGDDRSSALSVSADSGMRVRFYERRARRSAHSVSVCSASASTS